MKYRPSYPGTFETIDQARAYVGWYVPWYNQNHKHSGIALFSPDEVHDGTWRQAWAQRDATQQAYYAHTPSASVNRPAPPRPPGPSASTCPRSGDNAETDTERLHAA